MKANTMTGTKLTLGQAAKEVGISKPSLSAAIKKGRISAKKNESGAFEIDPAELFRVYTRKDNSNGLANSKNLHEANSKKTVSLEGKDNTLNLLLAERDKLLEEKDKSIRRLEQEKTDLREDLQDQKDQSKRITLLLENKSNGAGGIQNAISSLENRLSNQEKTAAEEKQKSEIALAEKQDLKNANTVYKISAILFVVIAAIATILLSQNFDLQLWSRG